MVTSIWFNILRKVSSVTIPDERSQRHCYWSCLELSEHIMLIQRDAPALSHPQHHCPGGTHHFKMTLVLDTQR